MTKGKEIIVLDKLIHINNEDFFSLTDIARYKNPLEPKEAVRNWLRRKDTIEYLGLWEQLNNPNFKGVEFDSFKNQAGTNAFTLSPERWIENTNAIGIITKRGKYNSGTYALGNNVPFSYKTVDKIHGVKVLEGTDGKHSLPEESHTSSAYIKLKPDGTFHEMRIYDENHYLIKEIAYHPEPNLDKTRKPILHIHEYKERNNFAIRPKRLLTSQEYSKYKKYFKGDLRWKTEN